MLHDLSKLKNSKLSPVSILKHSTPHSHFPKYVLKGHQYFILDESLSGDAPKDLLYVYEYGRCKKSKPSTWVPYIAKVGHKYYPSESITEQLISELGRAWGFNMANSRLVVVSGQLRFCSEYFLKKDQELIHGADIISRALQEADNNFVEQIDRDGLSQELLTLQYLQVSLSEIFPEDFVQIVEKLIEMLLFDALVGNNDRHFFNWGVIRHLKSKHRPFFSPIYDTARGLFWNYTDSQLSAWLADRNQLNARVVKYCNSASPKIGWHNFGTINHFSIVENIIIHNECSYEKVVSFFNLENLAKSKKIIYNDFEGLLSATRKDVIFYYLEHRFNEFITLLG